ncbi:hypothetical protein EUTSA_v10014978mg [Eutrema salsugineum]|uniref:Uncharacterized protein n=2 Tax=Eutrema salsugineum TaxID=72664 RepID=V4LG51_EUTSA|nr:hypothetical protein EUTSA_v10014978mg [Eutrema salsugineum]
MSTSTSPSPAPTPAPATTAARSNKTGLSYNRSLIKPEQFGLRTTKKDTKVGRRRRRRIIEMAARSPLIRFAFVCIVLAVLVMTAESHNGHHHGPTKAPSPAPMPHGPEAHAPAPSAATFSAYPQLIATALVGALSFVF